MKEILIYYPLYDFYIQNIIEQLNEVNSDFTVRMSSPGGEVFPSWGLAKKVRELSDKGYKSTLKIDGMAASMAGILAPFFDKVEAIDKAKIMIHPPWGADINLLKDIAKDFSGVLKSRVDTAKFKEIVGKSIDEVMNPESKEPSEVWLSAKQAKDIGLVDKVVKLTPAVKNEIESKMKAFYGGKEKFEYQNNEDNIENKKISKSNQKSIKMDLETLKNEHPALYNQLFNKGKEAGQKEERIRVNAWLAHIKTDQDKVVNGIKEGAELTADVREELFVAAQLKQRASSNENAEPVNTTQEPENSRESQEAFKEDLEQIKNMVL